MIHDTLQPTTPRLTATEILARAEERSDRIREITNRQFVDLTAYGTTRMHQEETLPPTCYIPTISTQRFDMPIPTWRKLSPDYEPTKYESILPRRSIIITEGEAQERRAARMFGDMRNAARW